MDFNFPGLDTRTLSEQGVDMVLKDLSGKPVLDKDGKPVTIRVLGPDSVKYRSLTRAHVRKRIQRAAGGNTEADFNEDDAAALEILVACTIGWSGVNTPKGEAIPATPENITALYTAYPAIREQVDIFIASRANFTNVSLSA